MPKLKVLRCGGKRGWCGYTTETRASPTYRQEAGGAGEKGEGRMSNVDPSIYYEVDSHGLQSCAEGLQKKGKGFDSLSCTDKGDLLGRGKWG